jgi:hypothetical protein
MNIPIRIIPTRIERTIITIHVCGSKTWLESRLNLLTTDLSPVEASTYQYIYKKREVTRATIDKIKINIGWKNHFVLFILE